MAEKSIPPRLELFSDAVFAIIITIMVLELHPPHGHELTDLKPVLPTFFAYVVSFINLIINWQNHHHLLRAMSRPTGKIMLANGHLLFWASLIPFATAWFGQNIGQRIPTLLYVVVFFLYGIAYFVLEAAIRSEEGEDSLLARAVGSDRKAKLSVIGQTAALLLAFFVPWAAIAILVVIAAFWVLPDRRIEKYWRS
jgi:uncharacterized membrane protein